MNQGVSREKGFPGRTVSSTMFRIFRCNGHSDLGICSQGSIGLEMNLRTERQEQLKTEKDGLQMYVFGA
jgi:hypothetical protein